MATASVVEVVRNGSANAANIKSSAFDPSGSSLTASRITLVDTDSDLAAIQNSKYDDIAKAIPNCPPKYTWFDHLLGVFCVNLSQRKMGNDCMERETTITPEIDPLTWPSPWILPVYVYPQAQTKGDSPAPKVAKCTIDTGNLQGNIVSREFVEKVLGYSAKNFNKLTESEERGGTGITGDLHVPQGAIYLTWYYSNSTRVFRNMRFLVSPYQGCDLIIGARSIQKDKILTIPCLMENVIITKPDNKRSTDLKQQIYGIMNYIDGELDTAIKGAQRFRKNDVEGLQKQKKALETAYDAYLAVWKILFEPTKEERNPEKKRLDAKVQFDIVFINPVSDELKEKLGLQKLEDELKADLQYTSKSVPDSGADAKASEVRQRLPAKGSPASSSRG